MSPPVAPKRLSVENVTFGYRRRLDLVLDGVSWSIAQGERVALLGPNGAGKSTLMKVLSGVLRPRGGQVMLSGRAVTAGELARSVARMPQHVTALPRLTALDQVVYSGWVNGMPEKVVRDRAGDVLARVGLTEQAGVGARELSGGQLRRLGLAETLVRRTPLVLLDEPTAGLDPEQRQRFRQVLRDVGDMAMLVATHETHDIADLFDRVAVLVGGRLLFDGPPEDLFRTTRTSSIEAAYTRLVTGGPAT